MVRINHQAEDKKLSRRNKSEIREMLLGHAQSSENLGIETAETSQGFTEEINLKINNES